MDDALWYHEVTIPALLRHARTTYGEAIRNALEHAGYDDIPGDGLYIIGGLAREDRDIQLRQLVKELGITKQGAGQLVDALVARGYLTRAVNQNDRRQLTITLTERGQAAAAVQRQAREAIDAELAGRIGEADVLAARRALGTLIDLRRARTEQNG